MNTVYSYRNTVPHFIFLAYSIQIPTSIPQYSSTPVRFPPASCNPHQSRCRWDDRDGRRTSSRSRLWWSPSGPCRRPLAWRCSSGRSTCLHIPVVSTNLILCQIKKAKSYRSCKCNFLPFFTQTKIVFMCFFLCILPSRKVQKKLYFCEIS